MEALLTESSVRISVTEAYERCERLAKTHYENFNVGSRLLPSNKLKHFYAIYAFCRFVDDLGDEFEGDRLRALDYWEEEVEACFSGTPTHPYMVAVQDTIRSFDIPREPFLRLIEANRMDQTTKRYATYRDLEHYCHHSANPATRSARDSPTSPVQPCSSRTSGRTWLGTTPWAGSTYHGRTWTGSGTRRRSLRRG